MQIPANIYVYIPLQENASECHPPRLPAAPVSPMVRVIVVVIVMEVAVALMMDIVVVI